MSKPSEFRFIGVALPNGIHSTCEKNEVIFSVCLNINKYCSDFITEADKNNAKTKNEITDQYADFYSALRNLRAYFDEYEIEFQFNPILIPGSVKVKSIPAGTPFEFLPNNATLLSPKEYEVTRDDLWNLIFPDRSVNADSKVKDRSIKNVGNLLSDTDMDLLNNYSFTNSHFNNYIAEFKRKDGNVLDSLNEKFKSIYDYGQHNEEVAVYEKIKFADTYSKDSRDVSDLQARFVETMKIFQNTEDSGRFAGLPIEQKAKQLNQVISITRKSTDHYASVACGMLDIDEVIHNFNTLGNEPVLMRAMGLIKDFKITLPENAGSNFAITVNATPKETVKDPKKEPTIKYLPAIIQHVTNTMGTKHAYILMHKNGSHFERTILKAEHSILTRFDVVSKIQQKNDYAKKILRGEPANETELKEALTRGILYTNSKLNEIIQPVDVVSGQDFIKDHEFHDEHFTRGHRVAMKNTKENKLLSLTCRSLNIKRAGQKEHIYICDNFESCIHIDAPATFIKDGKVEAATSNVLFEYSGELLKLKSAFSKANEITSADKDAAQYDQCHDDGLFKSEARFKAAISFYHFPKLSVPKEEQSYLSCLYGIPKVFNKDHSPKLRFDNSYTFYVYQEYLNGWGLPLNKMDEKDLQLSIEEILNEQDQLFTPIPKKFTPLENKRAVQLYARNEIHDDPARPMAERGSLDHLVVRSDNGDDPRQLIDERHVLPAKIELETAFWHGLLSSPNMNASESFDMKRKTNCPFADSEEYGEQTQHKDVSGKHKKCAEGCNSYCGGINMDKFYPQKHIYPRYLTDPTIKGFSIKLFWNKECTEEYFIDHLKETPVEFDGIAGIAPESYLLRAAGAADETFIENHNNGVLEVYLKKGMMVYAQLTNLLTKEAEDHLINGWWNDVPILKNNLNASLAAIKKSDIENKKFVTDRNTPKSVSLTHAVKEPIITPHVINLYSTPTDHKTVEHVNNWLVKGYGNYAIGRNIIATRKDKASDVIIPIGSSYTNLIMKAHFERLDAIRKIDFLPGITPTGVLELWMRKEEFIDDETQIVLDPKITKSTINHLPYEPVRRFNDELNTFNLEYKIDFSNEILGQLKAIGNIENIDEISDPYRSLISQLSLDYDFKTTKFEEREYYLKNISKFKGFFTDEKFLDDATSRAVEKLEEYTLPKLKDVMCPDDECELRFKVIVLNNKQPAKPDIAFAVTTIQETRDYHGKRTTSVQKGNIVTIYLKRGRLTSGKDERVGIFVDAVGIYKKLLKDNDLISKAGRDILSDKFVNRSPYLQYGDIIIPEQNDYEVGFDDELGMYYFLPQFDIQKQLWKIEVELDIKTADGKQMHNPFINFSLVHYQPFSVNYNTAAPAGIYSLSDLKSDCRISDFDTSTWCYLLPERKLSVFFNKAKNNRGFGEVDLTVSFDHQSLHSFNCEEDKWIVRSNFIVTVQGSNDKVIWSPVRSDIDNGDIGSPTLVHHALLTPDILFLKENIAHLKLKFDKSSIADENCEYDHFRVQFVEVEWFSVETWGEMLKRNTDLLTNDVLDNEEMRVRYVELVY